MKVLKVEPMKKPEVVDIDAGYESLQAQVGGYIEAIYPFDDPVALICNEDGKLRGLPFNRPLMIRGRLYDIIVGTFLLAGVGEEDFTDFPENLVRKYTRMFRA